MKSVLFTLLLVLLSAPSAAAQPGHVPGVDELQKQLQPAFDEIAEQIKNDRLNTELYVRRSKLYRALYERAGYHGRDGSAFAEKALADLSTAVELKPTREAYAERAGWYMTLAFADGHPAYARANPWADLFLKYSRFGAAESDLLRALRLSDGGEQLTSSYTALTWVCSTRAQYMATPAAASELRAHGLKYSAWDDFDRAAAYAKEWLKYAPKKASEWPLYNEENLVSVYEAKGRAAYALGESGVALAALAEGEQYLTSHYYGVCNYYSVWGDTYVREGRFADAIRALTKGLGAQDWNCRRLFERRADVHFAAGELREALEDYTALWRLTEERQKGALCFKRAKVYLKLNEPRDAVGELNFAAEQTASSYCPQIYSLRAQAFKLLGDAERAAADDRQAAKLGGVVCHELEE
jgi:hypothetical protein